ncbi:MAG: response regulator [Deltaproteobacteria bacterium]|nr:response regulator [Deltaproteobacteria bacterium]
MTNRKGKVLVIDDEQIVLDSVCRILADSGMEVDVSLSGRDGLAMALERPYDIVLTDIRMADLGGMVVLRDIKRAKPTLPVVMITGYASVRSAVQAMKLGAADYLEKPFTPEELTGTVASAMQDAGTREPEGQDLVHREEMIRVLERAATDQDFVYDLLHNWADALDDYALTGPEKLALLTGDVEWIEGWVGPLTSNQKKWLQQPLSAEMLRTYGW